MQERSNISSAEDVSLLDRGPVVSILPEVVLLAALHQEVLSAEASLLVDQEATGADHPNLWTVDMVRNHQDGFPFEHLSPKTT